MRASKFGGDPARIMEAHAARYIHRLKQLNICPVDPVDLLGSCLPITSLRLLATDTQWKNLALSMNLSNTASFVVGGHGLNEEHPFWMETGGMYPRPQDTTDGFLIDSKNEYYEPLLDWWNLAYTTDQTIQEALLYIGKFVRTCGHPRWVTKHWPDLMKFVAPGALRSLAKVEREPAVARLQIDGPLMEKIIDTLASCSLLENVECHAWIGYARGDMS